MMDIFITPSVLSLMNPIQIIGLLIIALLGSWKMFELIVKLFIESEEVAE